MRSLVKAAATLVLLLLAPWAWMPMAAAKAATLLTLEFPLLAALYAVAVLAGVLAVAGSPFVRPAWARLPLVGTFLVGFGADFVARAVQGEPLSSHMLATLIQARHEVGHAVGTYGGDIALGLFITAVLAPPLIARPQQEFSVGIWFLAAPVSAIALTFLLIGSFTGRIEEFPSPIAVPVQTWFAAKESSFYLGPREPLVYEDPVRPKFEKIIFVIDESIRGDYLQLNNPSLDNTPFLVSAQPLLANFGIATSYSNCSATARLSLRAGARETDFPDPKERIMRQPTLWQFAKRAGYRTIFLDTWLPVRRMSSMLTYDELRYVDERAAVSLVPYAEADDRVAERIISEVARPGPALLFVEKIGLHTPYQRNLPPTQAYAPRVPAHARSLDPSRAADIADYLVGVWWRVDRFFERLLPAIDRPGVLLIYTSDHGQALYEGGYDASNCSGPNAVRGEGLVPLFVFAGDESVRRTFQEAATRASNRAAHSDIFPTLLSAMGFDPSLVDPPYAAGLLAVPTDRTRRFFVFSPFGPDMHWVPVD